MAGKFPPPKSIKSAVPSCTGRDPDVTVRHDVFKLSKELVVGEVASIKYDKDRCGVVEDKAQEKALGR